MSSRRAPRRRRWTTPGPVGGAHLEHGGLRATPRGVRRPWARASSASAGRSRRGGVDAGPSTTASNRWRSTAGVEVLVGDLPHRDAVRRSCAQARAARTGARCSANIAADVGEQADPVRGDHRDPGAVVGRARPRRATAPVARLPAGRRARRRRPAAGRAPRRARRAARRARSRTSPARQRRPRLRRGGPGVGLGERAQQRRAPRRRRRRSATSVDGRRVVGVAGGGGLGEQQVPAHQRRRPGRPPSASKPIRVAIARAIGSPATLCSVSPPLPMSCSSAATMQHVGPGDVADQRGGLDAGLDDVPVDGEPVDRARRAAAAGSAPTRAGSAPARRSPRASPRPASRPRPGGEQPHQQLARLGGPRVGQRRALARPAGPRSAARAPRRARRPRRRRAAAAAGPRRVGARPSSTTSPDGQRDARARAGSASGRRAPRTVAGRASTPSTRRQVSRDRWVIRRPSSRTCTWAAPASARPRPRGEVVPHLRGDPVGGAPGDAVQRRRGRRAAPAGSARGRRAARRPARWRPAP